MRYLVDSDVLIDYLFAQPNALALIDGFNRRDLAISAISLIELLEGIKGAPATAESRRSLRSLLRGVRVLVVNRRIAERTADIRLDLRRRKLQTRERSLDLIIAATAIDHGLTLVTRNVSDYADIPDLHILHGGEPVA